MRRLMLVAACLVMAAGFVAGCNKSGRTRPAMDQVGVAAKDTEVAVAKATRPMEKADPPPLTGEAAWADPQTTMVFTERFEDPEAAGLRIIAPRDLTVHSAGIVAGAGPDGGNAYVLDLDLPAKGGLQVAMDMPETEIRGLTYRFHLKLETDPPTPDGKRHLSMEMNRASPFADSIYRAEPLEHPVVRDSVWMDRSFEEVFRRHGEHVHQGWTRYEGNTANASMRRFDGRKVGEPLARILHLHLRNLAEAPLRLRISLADIAVIRRDIDHLPAMQALLTAANPFILQTRAQIMLARGRAAAGMKLPRDIAEDLRRAEQCLDEDINVPRQQSGWPGAFHCQEEGCNGRLQPAPPEGYKCAVCGKMHTGELYDKLLIQRQHSLNGLAVKSLGFAWQWTDDERYARKAEAILLEYAGAIADFRLGHNWLGDCWLMENFIFGYDYIREWCGPESRIKIENDFLMPMVGRIFHYNHHYPEGYIRLMQACAWSALLARRTDWIYYLILSPTGNREVTFRYGLTDDFISLKGPAYHGDIIRGIINLGRTVENCGVKFFDDRARQMFSALAGQTFPDNSLPAFGHTNIGAGVAAYGIDTAYRYYRDPLFLALTSPAFRDDPATRIFWEEPDLPPVEPIQQPSSHLSALGVTLLRTVDNGGVLALSWGAPQRNDPTRLDFQLYGAGGHLLWSSGTVGYANPYYEKWYQKSISRNGLIVDEQTQQPKAGTFLLLNTDDPRQVAAAELVDAFPDTRWLRLAILFEDGAALIVDRLDSPTPRTVDWVCQLPGTVEPGLELAEMASPFGDENGYEVLTDIRGGDAAKPFSIILRHRGRGVRLTPAPFPGSRFFLANGRTGWAAAASPVGLMRREAVSEAVFATLLEPFIEDPGEPAQVEARSTEAGQLQFGIRRGERSWRITISEDRTQPPGAKDRLRVAMVAE